MFFPDLFAVRKQDKLLYKFLMKDYGDPFQNQAIDPDDIEFQSPDFGFDNYLVFEDEAESG